MANDKIFYTGDMANAQGWFRIVRDTPISVDLREIDGTRTIRGIGKHQIGSVYQGHCGTRFVTEAAYNTYRDAQMAAYSKLSAS